jgi:immunoglobulin-binding protein 1
MLQHVLQLFEDFLGKLDSYGILSAENRKLYERFMEDRLSFQLASSANAEERRNVKVARFQQEKRLKAKLEVCRDKSSAYWKFANAHSISEPGLAQTT